MLKGIDNFQAFDYNAYNRVSDNSVKNQVREQELKKSQENTQSVASAQDIDIRLSDIRPRQNASLEDISLSLNEPKGFEMKGRESDLEALDMEKAVSDMQKDQALMQYQYFVGDNHLTNSEDGIVIPK